MNTFSLSINNWGVYPNSISAFHVAGTYIGFPYGYQQYAAFLDSITIPNVRTGSIECFDSYGMAVNNSAQIVGYDFCENYANIFYSGFEAFMYQNGVLTDLGQGVPYAINNLGQVVGSSYSTSIHGPALFYTGGIRADFSFPGATGTTGYGINDSGRIVGDIAGSFSDGSQQHAFTYGNGVSSDLNTLIPKGSGWILLHASSINNWGQIVGYGTVNGSPLGPEHAFLLTPILSPTLDPSANFGSCSDSGYCDDPVNTALGNFTYQHEDIKLGGKLGIDFVRNYNSQDTYTGPLGNGWTHSFNILLNLSTQGTVIVKYQDGHRESYQLQKNSTFTPSWGGIYNQLVKNADGSYTLTNRQQGRYLFGSNGQLTSIVDKNGNVVSLSYTGGNPTTMVDPFGRTLTLAYDSNNHITQVSDPLGRKLSYSYDANGNLVSFTDAMGGNWNYQYDSGNHLTGIIKPDGNTSVTNVYSNNQVVSQSNGLGQTTTFQYSAPNFYGEMGTIITDHNGNVKYHTHDLLYRLIQDQDQLGHSIYYGYDTNNNRTWVDDRNYNLTQYSYDSNRNVTSKTDPLGNVTSTTYDTLNDPLIITDALGNQINSTYDSKGNLNSRTDQLGNVTSFTYNGSGQVLSITDANGHISGFGYDSSGNLTGVQDPLGDSKTYSYDAAGRQVSATDANGHTTSYAYDGNDNLLSATDALGNSTSFTYDPNSNKISSKDKNGNTTTYAYDANDRVVSVTGPLGNVTTCAYDLMGNKISETDPLGNTASYTYDAVGNRLSATDPAGDTTVYTYDANGNRISTTVNTSETTTSWYDGLNRLISTLDPDGNATNKTYDALGRLTVDTDANGGTRQYAYNGTGKLIQVTEAGGQVTTYAYDAVGNRTSMTDPVGNTTGYAYDAANRKISETDASQATKSYAYDGAGNVVGLQKPDGISISYGYDGANRLVQTSNPSGPPTSLTYDANGNRTAMQDSLGSSTWAYDAMNRMLSYSGPFGNGVGYAYDAKGNRTQIVYPGNHIVSYGYDRAGHLLSVSDWLGNVTSYSYDAAGRPTSVINPNGTSGAYTYDFGTRLRTLSNQESDGTVINSYQIFRDNIGNQVSVTRQEPLMPGTALTSLAVAYGYGADNRIETAGPATYTHDVNGNRTSETGNNAAIFTYDYLNRLATAVGSTNLQFGYDGLGNRLSRTVNYAETLYVVDPNGKLPNVIAETDTLGNVQDYYIYGMGLVYKLMPDGTTYTYHFDSRGSTIAMTDGTGQIVNEYSYGPRGERLGSVEGTHNPFGYVGRYGVMEEGNGLKFMRARYYDETTGRFLNKDLVPGHIRNPQSLNRYAYVKNNPINKGDPLGLYDLGDAFDDDFGYYNTAPPTTDTPYYPQEAAAEQTITESGLIAIAITGAPLVIAAGVDAVPPTITYVLSNPAAVVGAVEDFVGGALPGGPPAATLAGFTGYVAGLSYDWDSGSWQNPFAGQSYDWLNGSGQDPFSGGACGF